MTDLISLLRPNAYPVPTHLVTTVAGQTLLPTFGDGVLTHGIPLGIELPGSGIARWDPFGAYAAGVITAPNAMVVGSVGRGKSTVAKLLLLRSGLPGFIIDPKGEYRDLATALGWPIVRPDDPSHGGLDLFAPMPGEDTASLVERRASLTEPLISLSRGAPLDDIERTVLRGFFRTVSQVETVTIDAVVTGLLSHRVISSFPIPHQNEIATRLGIQLDQAMARIGSALRREGSGRSWNPFAVPGAVIDLSRWHGSDPAALPLVMHCSISALQPRLMLAHERSYLVVDEAWALLSDEGSTRWIQRALKLARQWGTAVLLITHRVGELGVQRGDVAGAIAAQLVNDVGALVLCGLTEQAAAPLREVGVSDEEIGLVTDDRLMRRGMLLIHQGTQWALVSTVLGDHERRIVDTDVGLRATRR